MSSNPQRSLTRLARAFSALGLLIAALLPASPALAQCPAHWLPGEGLPGLNGAVYAVIPLPSGQLLVAGAFTIAGNTPAANIARWSPTTHQWSPIGAGLDAPVFAAATLPSGNILLGGIFTHSGATTLSGVAAFNPATDAFSPLGLGVTGGEVDAIAIDPAGDAYFGGNFSAAGGISVASIARWSPSSAQWSSLGAATNRGITALAYHPSGDLYVGATFGPGGFIASGIARYNIAAHTWFPLGAGLGRAPYAITILSDGSVVAGGNFTAAGTTTVNSLARWNITTSTWSALGTGLAGAAARANVLLALPAGDLLVGGDFATAGAVGSPNIARWNASSSTWSAVAGGLTGPATALAAITSGPLAGQIAVGGGFNTAGAGLAVLPVSNIALLTPSTPAWSALGSGINGPVNAITPLIVSPGVTPDVYVGGSFSRAGTHAAANIARFNSASGDWSPLGSGVNGIVNSVAALPNGDAIVGGRFTAAYNADNSSIPATRIARWNASTNTWSVLGAGIGATLAGSRVLAITALPSGDIVAAGAFTTAGTTTAVGIALWSAATSTWSPMGTGADGFVYALAALPTGDIIAGGDFAHMGGLSAPGIARWNSVTHTWSAIGPGVNNTVYALALLQTPAGLRVAVAGSFTTAGGIPANSISTINPATNTWAGLGAFIGGVDPPILAIAPAGAPNFGDCIVGGTFESASGTPARGVARWNAAQHTWSALGTGTNASVYALASLPRGDVLAGGSFTTAGPEVSAYFAQWSPRPACPADFNCSGAADIDDIFTYLNAFLASSPIADFNGIDGTNIQDIFDYIVAWFTGC